jgi:hypothetical protein
VAKIYFSGSFPPADDRWTASAVTVQAKAEHADGTLETNQLASIHHRRDTTTTLNNALSDARSVSTPEGQYIVKARAFDKAGWSSIEATMSSSSIS